MFLDDEELSRIASDVNDPEDSLRSAVLSELRQTDRQNIFDRIDGRIARWRGGAQDQPPPCLPLLAVTVLAGTRMRRDGDFSSAAYYPRLITLMTSGPNSLTASGMKKHFDQVAQMWETLDVWIEHHQHLVGPSTIRTHPTFSRVGYPLSQTVLKASDRERLSDFFDRLHVDRTSPPPASQLLRKLRIWLNRPRGLSSGFLDLVQTGEGNPLLLAVITKLATAQATETSPTSTYVPLELALRINSQDWSADWVIPVHKDLEQDELLQNNAAPLIITRPAYGPVYDVEAGAIPAGPSFINHPYRATGTRSSLTKKVRQLWILRREPLSGQWQSVPGMHPGEQHLLVVRDQDATEIRDLLTKSAAPGHRKLRSALFPGWTVYADVSFIEPIDFSAPGSFNSPAQLLHAPSSTRAKLINGLALRTDLGGRHYLLGGEPDVQLPENTADGQVRIVLDHKLPGTSVRASGLPFPLRPFGPFTPGKHSIRVDSTELEFFVHASGSAAQRETQHERTADIEALNSAQRGEAPQYVLNRRGRAAAIWFVTPAGLVRQHTEPFPRQSLTRLGFPESYHWKAKVPGGTSWAITEKAGKFSDPQCITPIPPNFGVLDAPARAFWRRVAKQTVTNPDRLWRDYLSQSIQESIHGR
ncbi:hypothetical protein V6S67_03575 [Arthrobacter sp. Soc17.1.1.1]|uniref:hypothetical protein n=1 Tax=Arthrobacter sp. Soc17.1.1.1 TaxID=3121277 RepID=UPI002FE4D03E